MNVDLRETLDPSHTSNEMKLDLRNIYGSTVIKIPNNKTSILSLEKFKFEIFQSIKENSILAKARLPSGWYCTPFTHSKFPEKKIVMIFDENNFRRINILYECSNNKVMGVHLNFPGDSEIAQDYRENKKLLEDEAEHIIREVGIKNAREEKNLGLKSKL